MQFPLASSPHLKPRATVRGVMLQVLLAMVPGICATAWFFGSGVLLNLLIAITSALAFEACFIAIRKKPWRLLGDGSIIVTAALLGIAIPATAPAWMIILGIFFAVFFGKHLYGGLGFNPFNPAMLGYVVLLISFPLEMTQWLPANGQFAHLLSLPTIDAITQATALDQLRTGLSLGNAVPEISQQAQFGFIAAAGWEWISLAWLVGGIFLLGRGLIRWHGPIAMLLALTLLTGIFYLIDPNSYAPPQFHLFAGATMLGAWFIVTDPVSGCTTPKGRIIFGLGVGSLVFVIRSWGGYPDGVAFAVLLMNIAAPLIDQLTQPRVYGHGK